jgi:hypothetical protein
MLLELVQVPALALALALGLVLVLQVHLLDLPQALVED